MWELLRHKKIPKTPVLPALMTENAWLFNEKKKRSFEKQLSTSYFRIFRFLGVTTSHRLNGKLH